MPLERINPAVPSNSITSLKRMVVTGNRSAKVTLFTCLLIGWDDFITPAIENIEARIP